MAKQTSILFLSPGFPADEADTSCLPLVQSLVRAVVESHPDLAVHVIAFQYPFERRTYAWHGATVHAMAGRNRRFPLRLFAWLGAVRRARRIAGSYEVRAVHSLWLSECALVGTLVARRERTRHVASILGRDALPSNPYLRMLDLSRMTITACSDSAADAFLRSTSRRVDAVIPIGLDGEALPTVDVPTERDIDILGVGSLTAVKRFDAFLKVVAAVAPHHPDLRAEIIGDGPERDTLRRLADGLELSGLVRFSGHLPREQVLRKMRRSRILLHTAPYEGQGYVFLEALASGMHVVCGDVGYTGDGNRVHRCASTGEMTAALRNLLSAGLDHTPVEVIDAGRSASQFSALYGV